ncbi:MAG TPA: outer membrane beta-barrel protein [Longimicrobiales bacterium]|nr:outer membrane beta-barrel protein [Longimicrobiales bacterium]
MRPTSTTLFALLTLILAAAPARAQRITSPYRYIDERQSVQLFGGHVTTKQPFTELGPSSGAFAGGRYAIRMNGPLEIEAQLAYFPTTRTVRDTTFTVHGADSTFTPIGSAKQRLMVATAGLRFDLTGPRTWHGLQPFVAAGGGVAVGVNGANDADQQVPADLRFRFGTSFAASVGGGLEWYITRNVGLRGDARAFLWKIKTPQAFAVTDARVPANGDWTQNLSLTAGLAVHF